MHLDPVPPQRLYLILHQRYLPPTDPGPAESRSARDRDLHIEETMLTQQRGDDNRNPMHISNCRNLETQTTPGRRHIPS